MFSWFNSQRQDCDTAAGEFLFEQRFTRHPNSKLFSYKHSVSGLYLTCLCDGRDGLYLIDVNPSKGKKNRILRFIKTWCWIRIKLTQRGKPPVTLAAEQRFLLYHLMKYMPKKVAITFTFVKSLFSVLASFTPGEQFSFGVEWC